MSTSGDFAPFTNDILHSSSGERAAMLSSSPLDSDFTNLADGGTSAKRERRPRRTACAGCRSVRRECDQDPTERPPVNPYRPPEATSSFDISLATVVIETKGDVNAMLVLNHPACSATHADGSARSPQIDPNAGQAPLATPRTKPQAWILLAGSVQQKKYLPLGPVESLDFALLDGQSGEPPEEAHDQSHDHDQGAHERSMDSVVIDDAEFFGQI
ncbi:uncharacterized protein I303_100888 [Kwoniella dejecticola CBS 10117]|uniref:Uncharacterized protein n=1 Tax=Kwoniella dejecticola CBS 10117 TaxID=1296121 RepID=A0A1A6AG69_9TREE|nr:uncharacterized protein I303_00892 [Kwoniella dejecticola CBS 10117]OBR89070.1 hypothetical protein I303_00892 [Kwoniella dejecticola CBS 10117]